MAIRKRVARVDTLPLLPLRGMVAFPEVMLHLDVASLTMSFLSAL